MGDLNVVEAILTRLDDSDVRHRKSVVFRLKNSPANRSPRPINTFLTNERQVAAGGAGADQPLRADRARSGRRAGAGEQQPDPQRHAAVLRGGQGIIEQLDARPPMVMIQVLIAEIDLGDTNEFGIELGLQDSTLFDRSILSNIQTISTTTTPSGPAADHEPDDRRGRTTRPASTSTYDQPAGQQRRGQRPEHGAGQSAAQGLSNFGVGRTQQPSWATAAWCCPPPART